MISLRKPVKRINLYKVFHKAVNGYKILQQRALITGTPLGPTIGGVPALTTFPMMGAPIAGAPIVTGAPMVGAPFVSGAGIPLRIGKIEVEKIEEKGKGPVILEKEIPMKIGEPEIDLKSINIVYNLIPPFASANIKWNKIESSLFYYLIEPILTADEKDLLERIKSTIIEKIDIDFTTLRKGEAREYLIKRFEETINLLAAELPEEKRKQILYFVERDFVGLGKIEPMMQDPNIEDISCDGVGIPLFVFHRNPLIGSIKTNIVFGDKEELDTFVSKIAQRCGKNISIAVPLIGGSLPDGSRVQATLGTDIARKGSNFTIRKFTKRPLTPSHLIKFKTVDSKISAFLWLAVEYGRSILISGGVATGKTTLLNALSLFIRPELKVVSIEDSVTGDSEIIINRNGKFEKITIEELVNKQIKKYSCENYGNREVCRHNPKLVSVFSLNSKGKIILSPINAFLRHKIKKDIFEIVTRTGRKIKVTGDHSLFSLNKDGYIEPIEVRKLDTGSFIAVPRYIPFQTNKINFVNILGCLDRFNNFYICGEAIKNVPKEIVKKTSINEYQLSTYMKKGVIPTRVYEEILKFGYKFKENDINNLKIKPKNGRPIPVKLILSNSFLTMIGLWLAEGCYDKNSVIISNEDEECREIIKEVATQLNMPAKYHSDEVSLMLNSSALKTIMKNVLSLKGDAYTKEIPEWVFNLNNQQLGYLLKGYFSGDGHIAKDEIEAASSSIRLLHGIQTLLLRYGIISRIGKFSIRDKTYKMRISSAEMLNRFADNINFLQTIKSEKLEERCKKVSTHDCSDVIPLSVTLLKRIKEMANSNLRYQYNLGIGRRALSKLAIGIDENLAERISLLANSNIFWDQIKEINLISSDEQYVYDLSVPEFENFICENIIVHNTAELVLPHPHWVPSVARLALTEVEGKKIGEVDLFDLLKESLRQRPDYLIVGEVRGKEAYVLFQQIATGHSSMSTIHADSMERLIDRLTTPPIALPATLIEALDIVVFIVKMKYGQTYIRRIRNVYEILGFDRERNVPIVNELYKWNPLTDNFDQVNPSNVLEKITEQYGVAKETLKREIENRAKVIDWMIENKIEDYVDVSKIVKLYYVRPKDLLDAIG